MKISIIGATGDMGYGLALRLIMAGHDVCIGSRQAEKAQEAAQRATAECTISYDSVTCSYDSEADIWNVSFFTSGGVGGCQDVYLNSSGITYLIVYGE